MKTSKIQEITNVNERNKGEHGPVYYITMKLENQETITLGKKKKDAFKVGDTVSYEVVEEGKRRKEIKEQPFQKKVFNSEANNRGAMVGMAFKLAFELVYKSEDDFQTAVALANRIFEEAMQCYGTSNADENQESAKNDKLPF